MCFQQVFCHNIVLVSAVIYFILHLIKQRGIRTAKEITPDPDRRLSIYKRHLSADDVPFDEPIRKRRSSELEPEGELLDVILCWEKILSALVLYCYLVWILGFQTVQVNKYKSNQTITMTLIVQIQNHCRPVYLINCNSVRSVAFAK